MERSSPRLIVVLLALAVFAVVVHPVGHAEAQQAVSATFFLCGSTLLAPGPTAPVNLGSSTLFLTDITVSNPAGLPARVSLSGTSGSLVVVVSPISTFAQTFRTPLQFTGVFTPSVSGFTCTPNISTPNTVTVSGELQ